MQAYCVSFQPSFHFAPFLSVSSHVCPLLLRFLLLPYVIAYFLMCPRLLLKADTLYRVFVVYFFFLVIFFIHCSVVGVVMKFLVQQSSVNIK